jgi:hypothetical protein
MTKYLTIILNLTQWNVNLSEVLLATVKLSEVDHRFELFRDDRFIGMVFLAWGFKIEQDSV